MEQRRPNLPLPDHLLHLFRGDTESFQLRGVISPACPGSALKASEPQTAPLNVKELDSTLSHSQMTSSPTCLEGTTQTLTGFTSARLQHCGNVVSLCKTNCWWKLKTHLHDSKLIFPFNVHVKCGGGLPSRLSMCHLSPHDGSTESVQLPFLFFFPTTHCYFSPALT